MSEQQPGQRCSPVDPGAQPEGWRLAEGDQGTEVNIMAPHRKAAEDDCTSPDPALLPTWCKPATQA